MQDVEIFSPHLNAVFTAAWGDDEGASQQLSLVEINPLERKIQRGVESPGVESPGVETPGVESPAQAPVSPEPFALIFKGDADAMLAQGMYLFSRSGFPDQPIFITPVGIEDDGALYEAVFS